MAIRALARATPWFRATDCKHIDDRTSDSTDTAIDSILRSVEYLIRQAYDEAQLPGDRLFQIKISATQVRIASNALIEADQLIPRAPGPGSEYERLTAASTTV